MKRYALAIEVNGDTSGRGVRKKPLECGMGMEEAMGIEAQGSDKETIAGQRWEWAWQLTIRKGKNIWKN